MNERFDDRQAAGRALAEALSPYRDLPGLLVLGLARGGLPVAFEVARDLDAELDVTIVRKIRAPDQPELAIGAIGPGGTRILNDGVIMAIGLDQPAVYRASSQAQTELEERQLRYRENRPAARVRDRTVIIVDDGVATGASLEAAVLGIRQLGPAAIVVAVPVASREAVQRLLPLVDDLIVLTAPPGFDAVSRWYRRFDQTSDEEVIRLLATARKLRSGNASHDSRHA